jgi:hypothetical protein
MTQNSVTTGNQPTSDPKIFNLSFSEIDHHCYQHTNCVYVLTCKSLNDPDTSKEQH